jgi:hypothetical protein
MLLQCETEKNGSLLCKIHFLIKVKLGLHYIACLVWFMNLGTSSQWFCKIDIAQGRRNIVFSYIVRHFMMHILR